MQIEHIRGANYLPSTNVNPTQMWSTRSSLPRSIASSDLPSGSA